MLSSAQKVPSAIRTGRAPYVRDVTGLWADIPTFTAFAQDVHDELLAGELTYSGRQKLLRKAAFLSIRKFDANLIIAMVQNRVGYRLLPAPQFNRPRRHWIYTATLVLLIQSAIILLGWLFIRPML